MKTFKPNPESIKESTFIGTTNSRKPIYTPDDAKHIFVCGTTGSGKTIALSNYIKRAIENDYPALIVDGKGDVGRNSILDITNRLGKNKRIYTINLTDPASSDKYNPFRNASPTIVKDMLINMTDWSEEHYKLNTERYLQRLVNLLFKSEITMTFQNIIKYIPISNFVKLSAELVKNEIISKEEHIENVELSKTSGHISEGASARFSTIAESELGQIFDEQGIDIYTAFKEHALIVFILSPLLYPEISPLIGRLILIDSKKAVNRLFGNNQRTFFILDEISVYASPSLLDLVNKSRSANVTCILATQSLSDLDSANGEHFKEQIIENCNNYIVLRQNSAKNAEHWSNILGTRKTLDVTYQLANGNGGFTEDTGLGSARRVREYIYHPDEIKNLQTGKGIFMCKDNNSHSKINIHMPT